MKCSYIVIHHSATDPDTSIDDIRTAHLARGFVDIGYHYLIRRDGTVVPGRPEHQEGAHARGLNRHSLGVCCLGNFEETEPDPRQIQSLIELVRELAQRHAVPPHRIIGHRDVMKIASSATVTVCPGTHLAKHLDALRASAWSALCGQELVTTPSSSRVWGDLLASELRQRYASACSEAALVYFVSAVSDTVSQSGDRISPIEIFEMLRRHGVQVALVYEDLGNPDSASRVLAKLDELGVSHSAGIRTFFESEVVPYQLCIFDSHELLLPCVTEIRALHPALRICVNAGELSWLRNVEASVLEGADIPSSELAAAKAKELAVYSLADEIWLSSEYDQMSLNYELPRAKTRILGPLCESDSSSLEALGSRILFCADFAGANRELDAAWIEGVVTRFQSVGPTNLTFEIMGENPPETVTALRARGAVVSEGATPSSSDTLPLLALAPRWPGTPSTRSLCEFIDRGVPLLTNSHGNARLGLQHRREILVADTADEVVDLLVQLQAGSIDPLSLRRNAIAARSNRAQLGALSKVVLASLVARPIAIAVRARSPGLHLYRCLQSLHEHTKYPSFKTILFATEKIHGLAQLVEGVKGKVIVPEEHQTFGVAEICEYIATRYPDHDIVMMNDDLEVRDGSWLGHLFDSAYSSSLVSAACGKIIDRDGRIIEAGGEMASNGYPLRFSRGKLHYTPSASSRRAVGFGSSSLLYVRRDALDIFGTFRGTTPGDPYVEVAWQYSTHAQGWSTRYTPLCELHALFSYLLEESSWERSFELGGFTSPSGDLTVEELNG